jgi:hypothetical protein
MTETEPTERELRLSETINQLQIQQQIAVEERLQLLNLLQDRPGLSKGPKVNLPAPFSGNRHECRTFLNLFELNFKLSPVVYQQDDVKIATLGMLLRDKAANWNNIYMENPHNYPELDSWPAFKKHFELAFGDLDRKRSDSDKLTRLVQTTSAVKTYHPP